MKTITEYVLLSARLVVVACVSMSWVQARDETLLRQEAVQIARDFAGRLKPRLLQAMESGGPVSAISVCSEQAPEIARRLGAESGWEVKRVSLKARNDKTAVPDNWEHRVLEDFDRRHAQGEPADSLVRAETVSGRFRFMKAQPVESLCLVCHGTAVSDEVKAALASRYPKDQATGYSLGDIRGAISISRPLTEHD